MSIASLVLIVVLLAGKVGSISYLPAQATLVLSAIGGLVAAAFGTRCLWRRECDRGVAVFGLVVLLPAVGGHLLLLASCAGYIQVPA